MLMVLSCVQTVTQKEAPGFYNLIQKVHDETGCPNTVEHKFE